MNIGHIQLDFNRALPACLIIFTQPNAVMIIPSFSDNRFGFTVLHNSRIVLFKFDRFATSPGEAVVKARELLMAINDYILNRCQRLDLVNDALSRYPERLDANWINLLIADLRDFYRLIPTRG
ncbi:MAG TPA: hypothetical protein PLT32_01625 [bacterium]|nr:hypothetical protein [bacterium]